MKVSEGRIHSGLLIFREGNKACSSASVSSSRSPLSDPSSSASSPWGLDFASSACHSSKIFGIVTGSVLIFRLQSHKSRSPAITRQWNELPSAAILWTSCASSSSAPSAFFLKRALVYPFLNPIKTSRSLAEATRVSCPSTFLIKNWGR